MSDLRCDKCGAAEQASGIESVPEQVRPFIRGDIVTTMRPLSICGECYSVLCGQCANQGKCSVCGSPFLVAECPSKPPDDAKKRAKWNRVRKAQFGFASDSGMSGRKWWQFWK